MRPYAYAAYKQASETGVYRRIYNIISRIKPEYIFAQKTNLRDRHDAQYFGDAHGKYYFFETVKKACFFFACVQKLCEAFIEKLGNIIFSS